MQRRTFLATMAAMAGAAQSPFSFAQQEGFPARPIQLVVPYSPGGATDNTARLVVKNLAPLLRQSVVIDNLAGANGRLGAERVLRSKPDGYTLLMGGIGPLAIAPHLEKVSYDPFRDFTPISCLVSWDTVLVVNPAVPASNVPELIEHLRRNGRNMNYGSSGQGGPYHVAAELFKSQAKVEMTHIPYKGDGAALLDLISGNTQVMFTSASALLPHIKAGKVRLLASGGSKRSALFPEVKTISEQGLPNYSAEAWGGIFGPANMPKEVVSILYNAIAKAFTDPALREAVHAQGSQWIASAPDDFGRFLRVEYDKWGQVIREQGLRSV
jgi:tripartite-type tricarboxylate transporter receptor subunit TctC